jgi:RNA polymerase sigma-70 factor (ECF subfamily)
MGQPADDSEQAVLDRARGGDEGAFADLVAAYRAELHAYCYRMLGSVHDAEDALQDALLRAWKGLPGFEGRSSVRSWLYTIVTNTALDTARRRARRDVPAGFSPAGPQLAAEDHQAEPVWLEPYPGSAPADRLASSPEARYEQRETVELAFVIALQHLPPVQRAALILRDVMGFSARETADQLQTSVPAVTSALQRARVAARSRLPARSQHVTLRSLGDQRIGALAARYADAIERGDADLLISMLTRDATWTMPPAAAGYRGHAAIRAFLQQDVSSVRWQHRATRANGQLAVGCYAFDAGLGRYLALVLDVLTLEGDQIAAVTAFITAEGFTEQSPGGRFARADFARFGLPLELAG